MAIHRIEEFQITTKQHEEIYKLLQTCFTDYPSGRTYYKQLPHFRYLVYKKKQLVGHMAVEHRMISLMDEPVRIFGVVDICVHPDFQHNKIASNLLTDLELLGKKSQVDFVLLTADDHDLYLRQGYTLHSNICRWLIIHQHRTLGVHQRHLADCLLIKSLSGKTWTEGTVDLLGPVF